MWGSRILSNHLDLTENSHEWTLPTAWRGGLSVGNPEVPYRLRELDKRSSRHTTPTRSGLRQEQVCNMCPQLKLDRQIARIQSRNLESTLFALQSAETVPLRDARDPPQVRRGGEEGQRPLLRVRQHDGRGSEEQRLREPGVLGGGGGRRHRQLQVILGLVCFLFEHLLKLV